MNTTFKAYLFDLDDTLLDRDASAAAFAREQYPRFGLEASLLPAYHRRYLELDLHGYADRAAVYGTLAAEFALPVPTDVLLADFRAHAWDHCRLFPDTATVLGELRTRGCKLGIVTNGPARSQRPKLASSGLEGLVDSVLVSGEEGVDKPDPAIFLRCAARLGAEPGACVFVGDNPAIDVAGAHAAGMHAVWLRRHLPWPDNLPMAADRTIGGLTELLY